MPELPEVEILTRHLAPLLKQQTVRKVQVRHPRVVHGVSPARFKSRLIGAQFVGLTRRGKYLVFTMQRPEGPREFTLLGHLGMTGRMYLQPVSAPIAKHAAAVFSLGEVDLVFEDTRYFGSLRLDTAPLAA